VVIAGAGTAGLSIAHVLHAYGVQDITLCDSKGIVHQDRHDLNSYKRDFIRNLAIKRSSGTLMDALKNADIFVDVSVEGNFKSEMVSVMSDRPIIFALANPAQFALEGVFNNFTGIIATNRDHQPYNIDNAIAYPGFVKGVLQAQIKKIEISHIIQAAYALATTLEDSELSRENIIPELSNPHVVHNIVNRLITLL
jgi:malate dehydrogenase (oxaloacetate-decarboxylating)